jgi:hypothetical protein
MTASAPLMVTWVFLALAFFLSFNVSIIIVPLADATFALTDKSTAVFLITFFRTRR